MILKRLTISSAQRTPHSKILRLSSVEAHKPTTQNSPNRRFEHLLQTHPNQNLPPLATTHPNHPLQRQRQSR